MWTELLSIAQQRRPYIWQHYQTRRRHERISRATSGMFTYFDRNSLSIRSNRARPLQNRCLLPPCFSQGQAITDTFDVITRPTEGLCEPDSRRWMIAFISRTSDVSTFPSIINRPCNRTPQRTEHLPGSRTWFGNVQTANILIWLM